MLMGPKPLQWGGKEWFGNALTRRGKSTDVNWTSDAVDLGLAEGFSLEIECPTGAVPAQGILASTTSPFGLLFTANATGTGGNSITVTVAAGSGTVIVIGVVTNAITITPPTAGATNQAVLVALQNSAAACALVGVSIWGWQANGDPITTLQSDPLFAARNDLVTTTSAQNLTGGAASSAPHGVLTFQWSNDLTNWTTVNAGSNMTLAVTTTGPMLAQFIGLYARYVQVSWVADGGGSTGDMYGKWVSKGWVH